MLHKGYCAMCKYRVQVNMCCTEEGVAMPGRVRGQQLAAEARRRVETFCKQTNRDKIEKSRQSTSSSTYENK